MFCKYCGKEVDVNTAFCPHCGVSLNQPVNQTQNNNPIVRPTCDLAIVGLILAFVVPLAGLIVSILGLKKCTSESLEGKGYAVAGIIISSVEMAIAVVYVLICIIIFVGIYSTVLFPIYY